jgi:hypothetical protein
MIGLLSAVAGLIGQAVGAALNGPLGLAPQGPGENYRSLAAFFRPAQIVQLLLMAPFSTLWLVSAAAIPATVYAHAAAARDTPAAHDPSHAFGSAPQA